ncbi:MAG: hypothetical protein J3T61_10505, partial [Candidatus Brocadiales bacterium]|nr:hypothetical protein [Candidatus Bathyanammoxibius sp.]
MALPVIISGSPPAVIGKQNSYHGPFKSSGGAFYTVVGDDNSVSAIWCFQDGDNIHCVFQHSITETRLINCYKATDPTSSFTAQDTANRPQTTTAWDVFYARFSMSSDTWQDVDGSSNTEVLVDTTNTTQTAAACSIGIRSDSDIVVVYQGDSDMVLGTEYDRIDMNVSTNDGPTWAGPTSIDNAGAVDWTGCVIVPGSSDRMHVFFKDNTNSDAYQRRINSDDSLETFPSSFDASVDSGSTYLFKHGESYDDGGTQRVRCPYNSGTARKINIAKLDSADTPTLSTDTNVNDTVDINLTLD